MHIQPSQDRGNKRQLRATQTSPSVLSIAFARNVRRLRTEHNQSPEDLASLAGIDPAALEQAETGTGEPSLNFAWRIANALNVPFAGLLAGQIPRGAIVLRKAKASVIVSDDLGLTTRVLFPPHVDRGTEFYELKLAPQHHAVFEPHKAGTVEIVFISQGELEVTVGREPPHRLGIGDSICYPADLPHSYRNLASEPASLYLVITYGDPGVEDSPPQWAELEDQTG